MTAFRLLSVLVIVCSGLIAQTISTIAGGGPHNLLATRIGVPYPGGLALDSAGNIYVIVSGRNQVWKFDTGGYVSVYAGNGSAVETADNGAAVNVALVPVALAIDSVDNLYVATSTGIRKVSPNGTMTAFSSLIAAGMTFDLSGTLYVAQNTRVQAISPSGVVTAVAGTGASGFSGDGGPATLATLNGANSVAVDSAGTIYIADAMNFRIRKVTGGTISTVAGTGVSGYSGDRGLALSAQLNSIRQVVVDQSNTLFIVEQYDVREIFSGDNTIYPFAGNGMPGSGNFGRANLQFNDLSSIAISKKGFYYFSDTLNYRILALLGTNDVSTVAGYNYIDSSPDGTTATDASLYFPSAPVPDNAGSLLFNDLGASSLRKLTLATGKLSTLTGSSGLVNVATSTAYSSGGLYYVADNGVRHSVGTIFGVIANTSNQAGFSGDGGPATLAQFFGPLGVAVAANGDLYVADTGNNRVRVIRASTGTVSTVAGNGSSSTNTGDPNVALNHYFNFPHSVALDGAGNLFVSDLFGVYKVNLNSGTIATMAIAGPSLIFDPFLGGLFADESGNVFFGGGQRIGRIAAGTGTVDFIAGTGTKGFSGDAGPATSAMVDTYGGLTVDRSQNLYFSDRSGRIRTFPVSACFFTFSSPTYTTTSAGGTGSVTVTATRATCPYSVSSNLPFVTITSGATGTGSGTIAFSVATNTGVSRTATVAVGGASFTVSQAPGPTMSVGFFQPNGPSWVLDSNGSGSYDLGDRSFSFTGQPGAIAVVGDWNGDGRSKVGVYINGFWILDYNGNGVYEPGIDKFYAFGGTGYIPIVGDWSGSGTTKIGFYTNGFWALDYNGDGTFTQGTDKFYAFGGTGYTPVIGDWNGSGTTKIGYFYQGIWALDYNGDGTFTQGIDKYYVFGGTGYTPVVGDWNGTGPTKIGFYYQGLWALDYNGDGVFTQGVDKFYAFSGTVGETPFVADWNGDGRAKVGVYANGFWILDYNGNGVYDGSATDRFIPFYGGAGSQPIVGRW